MSNFKIFLLCTFVLACAAAEASETFNTLFKVVNIKDGDNKNFPKQGDKVSVHYTGTLEDGKMFDSSHNRNQPFEFTLKAKQVIECWDEVVSRMSVGQQIRVTCPFKYAYGDKGYPGVIPPKSNLVFEIELLKILNNSSDL
jgi:FKBP-type peptidyl-prolyl cis-trans isomerase